MHGLWGKSAVSFRGRHLDGLLCALIWILVAHLRLSFRAGLSLPACLPHNPTRPPLTGRTTGEPLPLGPRREPERGQSRCPCPSGLIAVVGILWTSLLTQCYIHDLAIIILPMFMVRQLQVNRGFIKNVLCWK